VHGGSSQLPFLKATMLVELTPLVLLQDELHVHIQVYKADKSDGSFRQIKAIPGAEAGVRRDALDAGAGAAPGVPAREPLAVGAAAEVPFRPP
jgi:hypothetical protein